ncbi:hypothetical protein Lal_00039824 [Lupinus albus]|nr:hypothetical protein Lal_00039824 [Lupinus albus]
MVSHVLKINPTYPKQVKEEEEELVTRDTAISVIDYKYSMYISDAFNHHVIDYQDCVIDYTVSDAQVLKVPYILYEVHLKYFEFHYKKRTTLIYSGFLHSKQVKFHHDVDDSFLLMNLLLGPTLAPLFLLRNLLNCLTNMFMSSIQSSYDISPNVSREYAFAFKDMVYLVPTHVPAIYQNEKPMTFERHFFSNMALTFGCQVLVKYLRSLILRFSKLVKFKTQICNKRLKLAKIKVQNIKEHMVSCSLDSLKNFFLRFILFASK